MLTTLRRRGLNYEKAYVLTMMNVVGRSLQAISKLDPHIQSEIAPLPSGFLFEMKVLPKGPGFTLRKTDNGTLKFLGERPPRKPDLSIAFKHVSHAFLVFSFQEGTARAIANDRMVVDGDVSYAMIMVRCLNHMEAFILPKLVAKRAVKRYPEHLKLADKLLHGGRIYTQVARDFLKV